MGRAILVLSVPRAGSSAVAGVLHRLGVDMGEGHLQQGNEWNAKGYFEDTRWQRIDKAVVGDRYGHEQPTAIHRKHAEAYKALAETCDVKLLWGVKDPRLCFTAQFVWPYLEDARVVAVMRNPMASALSLMRHSEGNYGGKHRMTLEEAADLRDLWAEALEARLREFPGPSLRVWYEELVERPRGLVKDLAAFAFDGLPLAPDVEAAVAFVDPRLRHHG